MALHVVQIATPPPGTDWRHVVPGRYFYDVVGITATLTTGGAPTVMHDSSGNGFDGTYFGSGGFPNPIPGYVSGDGAMDIADATVINTTAGAFVPNLGFDMTGDLTLEFWSAQIVNPGLSGFVWRWDDGTGFDRVYLDMDTDGNVQFVRSNGFSSQDADWDCSLLITDGLPHHLVVSYVPAGATLYVDGVAQVPIFTSPDPGLVPFSAVASMAGGGGPGVGYHGGLDEFAIYNYALNAGQAAAHFAAAAGGIAAYAPAVLADAPTAYYHLDEVAGGGREPSLIATDGTHELEAIPPGFPAVATPGPYEYSWQPGLRADTQSTDGTLTTVAIPHLQVPAGYTIGTRTLDLQPGDQWSDVRLWWNDAYQQSLASFNPYAYPPGATLTYQQIGSS